MRDASMPSRSCTAAAVTARRSSAGVSTRSPAFCHGTLATTSSTRSSASAWRTSTATERWPMWTGSNVPPRTPSLIDGSGAGQPGHDRRERVHLAVVDHDVAEAVLLATLLQRLADLVDGAEDGEGHVQRLVDVDAEQRRDVGCRLFCVDADLHEEREHLQLDVLEAVARGFLDPLDALAI